MKESVREGCSKFSSKDKERMIPAEERRPRRRRLKQTAEVRVNRPKEEGSGPFPGRQSPSASSSCAWTG